MEVFFGMVLRLRCRNFREGNLFLVDNLGWVVNIFYIVNNNIDIIYWVLIFRINLYLNVRRI